MNERYGAVCSLLQSGASLDSQDMKGRSVLQYSVSHDNMAILEHLWSYEKVHALLDAQDTSGYIALHLALRWSSAYTAAVLVAFGANMDVVGNDGKTSRQLAQEKGINISNGHSRLESLDKNGVWMADVVLSKSKG